MIEIEKEERQESDQLIEEARERSQSSRRLNNCLALEWPPVNSRGRLLDVPRSEWRVSPHKDTERRELRSGQARDPLKRIEIRETCVSVNATAALANNEYEHMSPCIPSGRNSEWRIYESSSQRSTGESVICVRVGESYRSLSHFLFSLISSVLCTHTTPRLSQCWLLMCH